MLAVYGPGFTERLHLERLFTERKVEKTSASVAITAIDGEQHAGQQEHAPPHEHHSTLFNRYYQMREARDETSPLLHARQVMRAPVVLVPAQASLKDAFALFRQHAFRHLPVVAADGMLIGIVSDRDIFHCICPQDAEGDCCTMVQHQREVAEVMQDRVLTAGVDTDVRTIAKLFVERHIGAVPIMEDHAVVGIITRSDILRAVMHNLALESWA
ncbi:MAG: CBS domain-containing protein [Mariprofundales bacterium]|nr:CBS domain-containing protein [Mariprofundales bacterium]